MPEDPQERRRRALEAAPVPTSDSQTVREENLRTARAEAARIRSEQEAQEKIQRDRQARHQALARQQDDATRAKIFARYLQAEEQAKLSEPPPPRPSYTARQSAELTLEEAAGRRALARHAQRTQSAAARAKIEEKAKEEDAAPSVPGFKA